MSVDIDLNYVGALDKTTTSQERPLVERGLESVFQSENLSIQRIPSKHAGGKCLLKYVSAMGGNGNLAVDVNFMFRAPLAKLVKQRSCFIGKRQTQEVTLLDKYELGAGKLSALFGRHASRDLFDTYELLTRQSLNVEKFRLYCTLYGAMGKRDWRTISIDDINFDNKELKQELISVLPKRLLQTTPNWTAWTSEMLDGCQAALKIILPLRENEKEFFHRLHELGEIQPALLTQDATFAEIVRSHLMLKWKVLLSSQNKKRQSTIEQ